MRRAGATIAMAAAMLTQGAAGSAVPQEPVAYRVDLAAGTWVRGPDLPSPRQDAAAAILGGRIYVVGGFGPSEQQMNTTLVLEPELVGEAPKPPEQGGPIVSHPGAWGYAAPVPEPVDHAAAAGLDGYLYLAGGRIEGLVTNKVWRYDPAADAWVELPSMPIPRYGPTMQGVNGKLYVIGGTSSHGNDESSIEMYDVATGSWVLLTDALGTEREASASVMLGDQIAIVGGRNRDERNLPFCDLFDPLHMRISACSPLHEARSNFGLAAVDGRLVALGGESLLEGLATQTVEISGPSAYGWLGGPWLPGPRLAMSVVTLGRVIWVIGGAHWLATAPTASVLRYVSPLVKVKLGGRSR